MIKGIKFSKAEELGVRQPKSCDNCKHCVRSRNRVELMKKTEAAELAMIEQNVTIDPDNNCETIRDPSMGDLSKFKDNQRQAKACAEPLEKKLTKNNTRDVYNDEYVVKKLVREETFDIKTEEQTHVESEESGGEDRGGPLTPTQSLPQSHGEVLVVKNMQDCHLEEKVDEYDNKLSCTPPVKKFKPRYSGTVAEGSVWQDGPIETLFSGKLAHQQRFCQSYP